MKLILFVWLVLVFVLGVGYGNNEEVDYDYFHLVLQWPESYCNTGKVTCYDWRPDWFIIHGMWPQKNGYTVSCPKISNKARYFNSEKLHDDLIASMEYYWPSLIKVENPNNKPFWSHEWSAHGSCTSFTQAEYFGKVVSIAAELPLASKLYSAGIRPEMPTYSMDIKDEIEKAFKLTPQIRFLGLGVGVERERDWCGGVMDSETEEK
ncbi:intracellular ribonuclease LX-like [Castanea sativa]|uniref:intracellular ribonuclease LX-like n=1 Tax=Castanea sativa TaxID=21020 RepID=UPI003F65165A